MNLVQVAIGIGIGVLIGAIGLWILDRRNQREVAKLISSRKKIERQRTQAVNDLFALRAEVEDPNFRRDQLAPAPPTSSGPDPKMAAEMANLRSLIARADGALTAARHKRDQNEAEIRQLRALLESQGRGAEVINLRPAETSQTIMNRSDLAL